MFTFPFCYTLFQLDSRKGSNPSKVDYASEDVDADMNDDVKEEIAKIKQICEEGKQADRSVVVQVSTITNFNYHLFAALFHLLGEEENAVSEFRST